MCYCGTQVTGAARGFGWGLALGLAEEGCKIAVVDVNRAAAENTAEEIRQLGGQAKVSYHKLKQSCPSDRHEY